MIFTRRFPLTIALALLAGGTAAEGGAQALLSIPEPQPVGRLMLDGYLSQYRLALPDARARLDGVGGRVMWALAPTRTPRRERIAEHIALGGFVGVTSDEAFAGSTAIRTSLYGAQLDVRPLRAPIAGVLEPVLSFGAGIMRLEETHPAQLRLPNGEIATPRDVPFSPMPLQVTERESHTIMTPAVGVLLSPSPGFSLRLDLRQLQPNSSEIGKSSELAAGVSLRL